MLHVRTALCSAFALLPLGAYAAAGNPLPRCSADTQSFYMMRYVEPGTPNTAPKTILELATAPATGAVTTRLIWDGQTAPTPSPRDLSKNSGASVAGGMGKDGYIYAMRSIGNTEPFWDLQGNSWAAPGNEWRTHTRHYEILRYGRDGVDNLGIVDGLGIYRTVANNATTEVAGAMDARQGPNFNAADIDPITGVLYVAAFRAGGLLDKMYRIDVTQTPPKYLSTLTLQSKIPGDQSGDFAIDASGQWAYGVATTGNAFTGTSASYRINLSSGAVEKLATVSSAFNNPPYGSAARLPNATDKMAFVGFGTRIMSLPGGAMSTAQTTNISANGGDAASCLPKFKAKLECTPTTLVDADNNISTCTVTLDQPAPTGGIPVALTLPADDPRYTTTCASPITVAANATTAQCTITATSNTTPADGDVTATIALATPAATDDYELSTPTSASILIQNDDLPTVTLACTPDSLTDSDNQVSTCTVTANVPAPTGGLTIALTPPAANPRYSSTCGASITLNEGASSNTCTITATPNTTPGDGDVQAQLALATPPAGSGYVNGTPSQAIVLVKNDDAPPIVTPIKASLACTPTSLVDSDNQVSTCTVSLSAPAPDGGLSINIAPPSANDRYSSTCASPIAIAAGASTATCSITATPNTTVGDGSASAVVQLLSGTGYEQGSPTLATVTINDDDQAVATTPIPTLSQWAMIALSMLVAMFGIGMMRRRALD